MNTLYTTPFSAAYWKTAAQELKKPKILVFAALMIALRVALKAVEIPVGPQLNITTGFLVNAMGAMVFGPVVALLSAAISDTLGCLLFPVKGPYFFPFIFVEMAGALIFSLFLYRTRVTTWRVMLSRFSVTVICNLIMNPALLIIYNRVFFGKDFAFLTIPRIVKNLCLFPAESFFLVVFLNVMLPVLAKTGFISGKEKMKFTARHVIGLIALAVLAALAVVFYAWYKANR